MELIKMLKKSIIHNADISGAKLTVPISSSKPVHNKPRKTVLNDILNEPDKFELVAYLEDNEIVMRARRRYIDATSKDTGQSN